MEMREATVQFTDQEMACEIAEMMCAGFEGFEALPYLDLLATIPTPSIGYGTTIYLDGRRVKLSDRAISEPTARRLLRLKIEREFLPAVRRYCPNVTDPNRLAALLDWTYNLGETNLRTSTMRKKIVAELWDEVPGQIRRWNRAGGLVRAGLVRRREAEVKQWLLGR
jgi:lysozyme